MQTIILILIITFITNPSLAQQTNSPKTWKKSINGISFSLKQILPNQVDAFYIGRGFSRKQIKPYTDTCVYTTILRNDNAVGRVHFIRHNWDIISGGKTQNPPKNSAWLQQFKQTSTAKSALIAFNFAQFPEEQTYEPNGDWNQGMLSVNLPIGSQFDLIVRWDINQKPYQFTLKGINCLEHI